MSRHGLLKLEVEETRCAIKPTHLTIMELMMYTGRITFCL